MSNLQQTLDAGELVLPPGQTLPPLPLFVGPRATVRGADGTSTLNAFYAGPGLIAGWPRGLLSDAHYTPYGYRTCGDSHLWSVGDRWSVGADNTGWAGVSRLTVRVGVTRHDGLDWHGLGIAGVQGPTSASDPQPWQVYCANGWVWLSLRTASGVRQFGAAIPPGDDVDCVFDADTAAGTVTCSLGPVTKIGDALVPGEKLTSDYVHGMSVGRLTPFAGAEGYFADPYRDVTVRNLRLDFDGVESCRLYGQTPRPATYPGGPPLPLVQQWPGRWFLGYTRGQPHAQDGVTLRDFGVTGWACSPLILLGGIQGRTQIDGLRLEGGTRGIASLFSAVTYPVHVSRCDLRGQTDCGIHLYRTGYSTIRECGIAYSRRCSMHLIGCHLSVTDIMESPGGQQMVASVIQSGGQCSYTRYGGDYEWDTGEGYRMFRLKPASWDMPWFPTTLTVADSFYRARGDVVSKPVDDRLFGLLPAAHGYAGETRAVVDGTTVYANTGDQ